MIVYRQPTPAERVAALDLIAVAFRHEQLADPALREAVLSEPEMAAERTVVAVGPGGRLLGHLVIKETAIALAGRWLPVGRLGTVCVHPTARRLGVGRRLVELAGNRCRHLAAMILNPAEDAYVLAFYESLGYVAASRVRGQLKLRPPAPGPGPGWVREADPADGPALADLYDAHFGAQPGTNRREEAWWRRRLAGAPLLWAPQPPRFTVIEQAGEVLAYAVTVPGEPPQVWEWAARPGAEREAVSLLSAAANGASEVLVHTAPHDPLAPALAALGAAEATPEPMAVMLRVADEAAVTAFLADLVGSAGATLTPVASGARVTAGEVTLTGSWSHLLALAYDGRTLPAWVAAGRLRLSPDTAAARDAVATVFPPRIASRRPTDAF